MLYRPDSVYSYSHKYMVCFLREVQVHGVFVQQFSMLVKKAGSWLAVFARAQVNVEITGLSVTL